ncbi:hypothetical protein AMTR_s00086p00180480 [Amborella trichopoda]|uniref:Uncharacterized protein n=1 Tax=Amborella trichopoda TaxID=13333 RepID=W1NZ33_AMBTC|nr:hypothetical protein AMTR_s00086p00180480 [Amborella trichopoda]
MREEGQEGNKKGEMTEPASRCRLKIDKGFEGDRGNKGDAIFALRCGFVPGMSERVSWVSWARTQVWPGLRNERGERREEKCRVKEPRLLLGTALSICVKQGEREESKKRREGEQSWGRCQVRP